MVSFHLNFKFRVSPWVGFHSVQFWVQQVYQG
nr:MAG TPA: hypothetical protein [Caudoviricetes sp.]